MTPNIIWSHPKRQDAHVKSTDMAAHLRVDRYGDFCLTEAVRPALDLQVIPRQGYRVATYQDASAGLRVPVLAASVSSEHLFEVFLDMLEPLGPVVNVILETSHQSRGVRHNDLVREGIDLPVLQSTFLEFEDLLTNDGCTGVAVVANGEPIEVQFDEHKLLIVYARDLKPFQTVLRQARVAQDDKMKLLTEGEHLHTTDPRYADEFRQLCYRLGVGETAGHVSW